MSGMSDPAAAPSIDAGVIAAFEQEYMRAFVWRKVVERPAATRALFLAAHADDVEIGCGGIVLKLIDAQTAPPVAIQQVVLTDGRLAAAKPEDRDAMAKTRADEANSIAAHLMLPPPILFGVPEGELALPAREAELVARLAKTIAGFKPDALFVPYFFDQHPDHRYANHLLARALPACGLDLAAVTVYAYECWAFVPPALVVDVTSVLPEKKRLVSLYRSQLALTPYLDLVDQLAKPRAALAGPRAGAVEFLFPFRAADYVARALQIDLASPKSLALNVNVTPFP